VDVDQRPNLPASNYGLTLFLGVLYHLKNPFLVLETLARSSRHIFLSSRIASRTPGGELNFGAFPMAYLVDEDELNRDPTNFWIFSEAALKRLVQRAGWNLRHYATVGALASAADPVTPEGDTRAYLLADSRFATMPAELHLDRGWHELEYNCWRWTARRFSAVLNVEALLHHAALRLRFHLPKEALEQRPAVTLGAVVNGTRLRQSVFSTPGEHEYAAPVALLDAGVVHVEFELDSAIRPMGGDQRELGVLVNFAGAAPITVS
jgi:hypothetical protein